MLSLLRRLVSRVTRRTQAGVDVSSYQGAPAAWHTLAGAITWAAVKITELEPGGIRYVNPDADADWAYLRRSHKGRLGYLFGHPSVSATATVNFFVTEVRKLGLERGDGVVLDLEVTDGLGPAAVDAWSADVMAALKKELGREPVLYTFLSFARAGNCGRLGRYPLWISDPSSRAGHPQVPAPWKTWAIHQHVITGPIDRDVANYASQADMARALGKPEEPKMEDIGGSIVGSLAVARWPDSVTVVAGVGKDGFVQAIRWNAGAWGNWKNVSPTKAKGAPGLLAIGTAEGRLYYTNASGHVIVLATADSGQTWT
jgi:lysozyme